MASGNSRASTITPTRMSTRAKSSQEMLIRAGARSFSALEPRQHGARVVVLDDSLRTPSPFGHRLGAPLIEPDAVAIAATDKPRDLPHDGHREERALEHVVPDEP